MSGKVFLIGPVANALVCVDRNQNKTCDAGEPFASLTGVDGAYSITYIPLDSTAATELAAAPVIAKITAGYPTVGASYDTVDTARIEDSAVLSAPAAKRGQINPLTTMVQAGIASGLSIDKAEAAVALQLAIPVADVYDYQSLPAYDFTTYVDNARLMALVAWYAVAEANLSVIDPASVTAPTASDQLASLSFTNPSDYVSRTYPSTNAVDVNGRTTLTDTRVGMTAGAPTAHDVLYPTLRLAASGWVRCDETSTFTSTLGTPSRSDSCGGASKSVGYTKSTINITGQRMVDVVTAMQAQTASNTITGVNPNVAFANPSATFPVGSTLRYRESVDLTQPYYINNSTSDKTNYQTLEAFITGRPASAINLATVTQNAQQGNGTFGLGLVDASHLLRAAFIDAGTVQYYSCESAAPNYTTFGPCVKLTTGVPTIRTLNSVRVMDFANQPVDPNFVQSNVRSVGEYGGSVYSIRKVKPANAFNESASSRLNGTAWAAMKTQLGL